MRKDEVNPLRSGAALSSIGAGGNERYGIFGDGLLRCTCRRCRSALYGWIEATMPKAGLHKMGRCRTFAWLQACGLGWSVPSLSQSTVLSTCEYIHLPANLNPTRTE